MEKMEPVRYEDADKVPEAAWVAITTANVPPGRILMSTKDGRFEWVKPELVVPVLTVLTWIAVVIAVGIVVCGVADYVWRRWSP